MPSVSSLGSAAAEGPGEAAGKGRTSRAGTSSTFLESCSRVEITAVYPYFSFRGDLADCYFAPGTTTTTDVPTPLPPFSSQVYPALSTTFRTADKTEMFGFELIMPRHICGSISAVAGFGRRAGRGESV